MKINETELRNKIIKSLKSQGFIINPQLEPKKNEKDALRKIHEQKKNEQLKLHKKFLAENLEKIKKFSISGEELDPEKIDLKLIEVEGKTPEARLFLWWNLIWWSIPYDRPIGRQIRFILWDDYHDAPFGLIGLQSPPLRSSVRDKFLGLNHENVDYWINQSLYAQRIGALPPYNELIGGKMAALALTSNEIRELYAKKYENKKTLLKKRKIPSRLLFITTTSAYGKSSIYERINYNGETVSQFLGYTSGSGTFQLPEEIYQELLQYLQQKGKNTKRGYGTGPSRKLKLISAAFRHLKITPLTYHNIKRGYYIFPNAKNLQEIIHKNKKPIWHNRPFTQLTKYWKNRWGIPRSKRTKKWKNYNPEKFFKKTEQQIKNL